MKVLVLNAGSSSHKCTLYDLEEAPPELTAPIWEAHIDWEEIGRTGYLKVSTKDGSLKTSLDVDSHRQALVRMLNTMVEGETRVLHYFSWFDVFGHRVVHGGYKYADPTRVDAVVKKDIAHFASLAPLHNSLQLEGIEIIEDLAADMPQFAVFDTAFHHDIPRHARTIPIPYEWFERGIQRYGFHGISHEHCAVRAAKLMEAPLEELRLITCHLGNGASLAAIRGGKSVDTTMGFSPLEGLMMGTRSGSIDPSIPLHLMKYYGVAADEVYEMLNKQSGLKGISGLSSDMREIHRAIEEGNDQASLALDMYIYHLRVSFGAMLAALGGVDAVVFTAGVGENDPVVRAALCKGFEFIGLHLNPAKNAASLKEQDISDKGSTIQVFVLPAQENWAIAQACWNDQIK